MATLTYRVKGMHCASCEILIEKKLLEFKSIKAADVSIGRKEAVIEYKGDKPDLEDINRVLSPHGYTLFSKGGSVKEILAEESSGSGYWAGPIAVAAAVIATFWFLSRVGFASLVSVTSGSSLPAFFVFGIIAGLSSCAALIGGLVLSLSKQWTESYSEGNSLSSQAVPHLMFNLGRVISFGLLGAALGLVGEAVGLSAGVTSVLIVVVSVVMAILGLQMLGVKSLSRFQIALPKSVTHKVAGEHRSGRGTPFFVGFLTFLLPCGFTLVAEGAAVLAGDPLRSALIMMSFALGTFIPLIIIGLSSSKLLSNKSLADDFMKTAGILILFFVLFNLNTQFSFTQRFFSSNSNGNAPVRTVNVQPTTPTTVSGDVQVLKTVYTRTTDIRPNTFEVKAGQPVRMEVDVRDNGTGCMSTIMIPRLYNQAQYLQSGQTLVMEFVPTVPGNYQITCAMGVPRGVIRVI